LRKLSLILLLLSLLASASTCRRRNSDVVTVAITDKITTLDTLTTTSGEASNERIRNLLFNSLVRKDEHFDYVGELAREINPSPDGKAVTFTLRDGIKFHNGKELTSADVKYTLDQLFAANGYKAGAFFDTAPDETSGKMPRRLRRQILRRSNSLRQTPRMPTRQLSPL